MKEAPGSSEMSVLTRATWCNIPEDTILRYDMIQKESWETHKEQCSRKLNFLYALRNALEVCRLLARCIVAEAADTSADFTVPD
jgi:hypothetical protein